MKVEKVIHLEHFLSTKLVIQQISLSMQWIVHLATLRNALWNIDLGVCMPSGAAGGGSLMSICRI